LEKATGAVLTDDEDPRITRIELFMRRWRIDEIPQLLNVLKAPVESSQEVR
jgi:lipopolysaccharide/colanic/teichoic acid biosynthesis glycosyltransferase